MPLGATTVFAVYCLSTIDATGPSHGLAQLTGVNVTVVAYWWRRDAALSIVTGTGACLAMTNYVLPT